jgi:hypothetical protein
VAEDLAEKLLSAGNSQNDANSDGIILEPSIIKGKYNNVEAQSESANSDGIFLEISIKPGRYRMCTAGVQIATPL